MLLKGLIMSHLAHNLRSCFSVTHTQAFVLAEVSYHVHLIIVHILAFSYLISIAHVYSHVYFHHFSCFVCTLHNKWSVLSSDSLYLSHVVSFGCQLDKDGSHFMVLKDCSSSHLNIFFHLHLWFAFLRTNQYPYSKFYEVAFPLLKAI